MQDSAWPADWATREAFSAYAHLYVLSLGAAGDSETLVTLLATQRKRARQLADGSAKDEATALGDAARKAVFAALHVQLAKLIDWMQQAEAPPARQKGRQLAGTGRRDTFQERKSAGSTDHRRDIS